MLSPFSITETLRRVEENEDSALTQICIRSSIMGRLVFGDGVFTSSAGSNDFSQLGASIGQNTCIVKLDVTVYDGLALKYDNIEFLNGLKQNASIRELSLNCESLTQRHNLGRSAAHGILEAYQVNNNLTCLVMARYRLEIGDDQIITATLRCNTNLTCIHIVMCGISNEQLVPIIDAIRGHTSLEYLSLDFNRIGDSGCASIATLLQEPNCSLHTLTLWFNDIGSRGVVDLTNGLVSNKHLRNINLHDNPLDTDDWNRILMSVLCDYSSLNNIYYSNHSLERVGMSGTQLHFLRSLLEMNRSKNKSHVAIMKIVKYHFHQIDMEPLFDWNMEGEGERDLKALPYVIAWFDRAAKVVVGYGMQRDYGMHLDREKLSSIYQFARALPLFFVPPSKRAVGKMCTLQ